MWVKGNLHTHTTVSDGDGEPADVCRYYADRGYHFLAITDHMARVDPGSVDSNGLLLIPGEEMHTHGEEHPEAPLHVCGFGLRERVTSEPAPTKAEAIQNCIDAITKNGGIAQISHPNWHYAFDHTTIAQTHGADLLEVFNGHPTVYSDGDADHISVERMWDHLLSSGKLFYATAVDDAHHFQEFQPSRANPCRGWIWARVKRLTVRDVLSALKNGDFYASTGVELEDVIVDGRSLRVIVRPESGESYRTLFIGDHGEVLGESDELDSICTLDAGHNYVRAKVIASSGKVAWTQAVVG